MAMEQIEFNKIYFGVDDSGYINLLFTGNKNEQRLYFDGINFYRIRYYKRKDFLNRYMDVVFD
jgi:hypothetical protein